MSKDFFAAVEVGDLARVRDLLEADAALTHARNDEGATALHVAAFNAHRPLVELLRSAGADINARDLRFGATPAGWRCITCENSAPFSQSKSTMSGTR